MSPLEQRVLDDLIGVTACIVDRHRQLAAMAYARQRGIEVEARKVLLERRFAWINWLTVTQRKWQRDTRNPNKARHHDSVALREKYVRC